MKHFCQEALIKLSTLKNEEWARTFCELRVEFHRKYSNGLVFSTFHGVDFFNNVINCLDRAEWTEKGEYGNNFRKLIKNNIV